LNASAENDSLVARLAGRGFTVAVDAPDGGISIGEGMNSMTASSSACTPLFLNAVPHMHSTTSFLMERCETRPDLLVREFLALEYLCMSVSLASAATSIILARCFSASSLRLAGIHGTRTSFPWVSMSQ